MKVIYPVRITPAEEGGFIAWVPDLDGGTQGETLIEAIEMARDYISISAVSIQDDLKQELPKASEIDILQKETTQDIITLVDSDIDAYRRKIQKKAVKKTLTIPSWLNEKAEAEGINFSQTLQEALIEKLAL